MRFIYVFFLILLPAASYGWAYRTNYKIQEVIDEYYITQSKMETMRKNIRVYQSEWAYLNRPERLRKLANLYYEELRLIPIRATHFIEVEHIPFSVSKSKEKAADNNHVEDTHD